MIIRGNVVKRKRNKIVSLLEYSARNKILVGILAVSLIGAGGVFLSSQGALSNSTMEINKTVLAGILNNDGNKACVINGNDSLVLYTSPSNSSIQSYISVGEMLTINSYSNGYYNVTVQETGATGYIASSNMQKIVSGVGYDLTSLSGTGYIYGEYIVVANSSTTTSSSSKTTGVTSNNSNSTTNTTKSGTTTTKTTSSNNTSTTKATSSKSSNNQNTTKSNTLEVNRIAYVPAPYYDGVSVMSQPSTSSTTTYTMFAGDSFLDISQTGDWVYVEVNGVKGYLLADCVQFTKPTLGTEDYQYSTDYQGYNDMTTSNIDTSITVGANQNAYIPMNPSTELLTAPNPDASVLTKLFPEMCVYVESVTNGWAKVQFSGQIGYVKYSDLTYNNPYKDQQMPGASKGTNYKFIGIPGELTTTSTFYWSPNKSGKVMFSNVPKGTKVVVEYESDGWYYINYEGWYLAYVPCNDISIF